MNNSDLSFLTDCSNEQLRLLADVLVFDPKDHKKRYTERLSARASYAVYYPHDMKKLLPEIVDEYQRFGGNTIANIIRGHGVPYREILKDVCKTVGIAKSDTDTVEIMEAALLKTVADKMLEQIAKQNASGEQSVEEMKKYVEEFTHYPDQMTELILMSFSSWLSHMGVRLVIRYASGRVVTVPLGPIAWAITAAWMALDFASPAYRVTIPSTILIACLRHIHNKSERDSNISFSIG